MDRTEQKKHTEKINYGTFFVPIVNTTIKFR